MLPLSGRMLPLGRRMLAESKRPPANTTIVADLLYGWQHFKNLWQRFEHTTQMLLFLLVLSTCLPASRAPNAPAVWDHSCHSRQLLSL